MLNDTQWFRGLSILNIREDVEFSLRWENTHLNSTFERTFENRVFNLHPSVDEYKRVGIKYLLHTWYT